MTSPLEFLAVKAALEEAGFTITDAALDMVPTTTVTIGGEDAKTLIRLVDALEDNDDVQKVYANFEVPDDELAALE
jgi:transcriptional/translational regulatory protein YebC/TACO1